MSGEKEKIYIQSKRQGKKKDTDRENGKEEKTDRENGKEKEKLKAKKKKRSRYWLSMSEEAGRRNLYLTDALIVVLHDAPCHNFLAN